MFGLCVGCVCFVVKDVYARYVFGVFFRSYCFYLFVSVNNV